MASCPAILFCVLPRVTLAERAAEDIIMQCLLQQWLCKTSASGPAATKEKLSGYTKLVSTVTYLPCRLHYRWIAPNFAVDRLGRELMVACV